MTLTHLSKLHVGLSFHVQGLRQATAPLLPWQNSFEYFRSPGWIFRLLQVILSLILIPHAVSSSENTFVPTLATHDLDVTSDFGVTDVLRWSACIVKRTSSKWSRKLDKKANL